MWDPHNAHVGPSLGPPRKFQDHPVLALDLSGPLTPLGPPWYPPPGLLQDILGCLGTFQDPPRKPRNAGGLLPDKKIDHSGWPWPPRGCLRLPPKHVSDVLSILLKRAILHRQATLAGSGIRPKQVQVRNRGLFHSESSYNSPFPFLCGKRKKPSFFSNLTAFRLDFCIRT